MGPYFESGVFGNTSVVKHGVGEPQKSSSAPNNYSDNNQMFYDSGSHGVSFQDGISRPHKRHLHDAVDSQHNAKRRLIDHLGNLSIGKEGAFGSASTQSGNGVRPTVFGSFTDEQLNRPLTDPNRVVIRNIDQFLRENPDQLDLIGEKVKLDDLRKAGLDKLVISCGLDIKKAWNKIASRYRSKRPEESKNVDDLVYRLIWEEYLAKYFSLIKYYDPLKMVWEKYTRWLKKKQNPTVKSPYITELENDGDEIMVDEDESGGQESTIPVTDANNASINQLSDREQSLRDGTSGYGTYYSHDDHWNSYTLPNYQQMDAMIEDVDDYGTNSHKDNDNDVMMVDD